MSFMITHNYGKSSHPNEETQILYEWVRMAVFIFSQIMTSQQLSHILTIYGGQAVMPVRINKIN